MFYINCIMAWNNLTNVPYMVELKDIPRTAEIVRISKYHIVLQDYLRPAKYVVNKAIVYTYDLVLIPYCP